jgi:hypothetical protein
MLKQNLMPLLLYAAYLSVFIGFKVVSSLEDTAAGNLKIKFWTKRCFLAIHQDKILCYNIGLNSNRQSNAKPNGLNQTNVAENETNVIVMQNQTNLNDSKETISKDDGKNTVLAFWFIYANTLNPRY